ncbi:MAG TPA: single-stranded DNA-binding protein [Jatrophihabitantaceae bacterium]|jgi:single-strand DNA-binding protein|nr:single-stranded DNA-binding protein [Jatrophihabitantaceae bacterium]
MYDTTMTLIGNLVDSPKLRKTKNGHFVASFRVASTPRRFDREQAGWVDGKTLFVTVTCWRALGENVAQSLRKGQPVVVFGRYLQREWEKDEALKTAYELEALAVGHDLSRGVTNFEKVFRPSVTTEIDTDAEGVPADETGRYLDLDDESIIAEVDVETGEVHELVPAG